MNERKKEIVYPAHSIRLGKIKACVWRNDSNGDRPWYSLTFSRAYRDAQGKWHDATSFGPEDLPVLAAICEQLQRWSFDQASKEEANGQAEPLDGASTGY